MFAADAGNLHAVKTILDVYSRNAVNELAANQLRWKLMADKDGQGRTALMFAVKQSNLTVVDYLLQHGTQGLLEATDISGHTALYRAKYVKNYELRRAIELRILEKMYFYSAVDTRHDYNSSLTRLIQSQVEHHQIHLQQTRAQHAAELAQQQSKHGVAMKAMRERIAQAALPNNQALSAAQFLHRQNQALKAEIEQLKQQLAAEESQKNVAAQDGVNLG